MKSLPVRVVLFSVLIAGMTLQASAIAPADPPCLPCSTSVQSLLDVYASNPEFKALVDEAFANIQQLPAKYPDGNPWIGKGVQDMADFLCEWCTFLPTAKGSGDTGLKFIQKMAFFYYKNAPAVKVVQTSPGREILQNFAKQRGVFLDSPASTAQVANWLADPRMEKEDYTLPNPDAPDGGFNSFNDFFSRTFKNQAQSRPQTMPDRDYVISAPTDAIMNSIPQKIVDINTPIPTKGGEALNIKEMLGGSKYAEKFVGGTALSCVLMPNTYHHFHAPVSGQVVESKILDGAYYGYDDFPTWVATDGNVGYHGTDFDQFGRFKRGYFIVDTGRYGHVAMIAVGLNTISSIIFKEPFNEVTVPVPVTRGDELGYFLYGGSLFIMIFEPEKFKADAIQVRLGNQIGVFDTDSNAP
jgi:phosphatidylserine decarboxylase